MYVMAYLGLFVVFILATTVCCQECYENDKLKGIPSGHVYHRLKHPCVIGHMGNIQEFQENTIKGIKSLIEIKADGIHMHVQMTDDHQLILFQDENLYRLTGEDFKVSALPYNEIYKMNLLKNVPYYKKKDDYNNVLKTYNYRSTNKIPLLREALMELRGKRLLIYIELVPKKVSSTALDRYIAIELGKRTAKLIHELKMEKEVLVVSRDLTKLLGVASQHPGISTGWWTDSSLYQKVNSNLMKDNFAYFPRVYHLKSNCLNKTGATGFSFMKYLVSSGFMSKVVNSSFIDFSAGLYLDKNFYETAASSSLKDIVRKNYGDQTSFGVFGVFTWNDTKTSTEEEDKKFIKTYRDAGVTRIMTDDVNRVKRALDEETTTYSGSALVKSYMRFVIFVLLLSKTMTMLVYI